MEPNVIITESAGDFKRMARSVLKGRWLAAGMGYVVYMALLLAPAYILEWALSPSYAVNASFAELLARDPALLAIVLYPMLVVGPLCLGLAHFILNLVRNGEAKPGMILSGFENSGKAIGAFFLYALIMIAACVLFFIPEFFIINMMPALADYSGFASMFGAVIIYFLLTLVFLIVPIAFVSIMFAPLFFILSDNPEMGVGSLFKQSYRMMRGNKLKFLSLLFSFIGWLLLTSVVLTILNGLAFNSFMGSGRMEILYCIISLVYVPVTVYMETAKAIFYETLAGNRRPEAIETRFSVEYPRDREFLPGDRRPEPGTRYEDRRMEGGRPEPEPWEDNRRLTDGRQEPREEDRRTEGGRPGPEPWEDNRRLTDGRESQEENRRLEGGGPAPGAWYEDRRTEDGRLAPGARGENDGGDRRRYDPADGAPRERDGFKDDDERRF